MAAALDRRCEAQRRGLVCKCPGVLPAHVRTMAHRYRLCRAVLAAWLEEGMCQCCHGRLSSSWVLDHCHETGLARGVVCRRCNIALAYIEDEATVRAALRYLGVQPKDNPFWERPARKPQPPQLRRR